MPIATNLNLFNDDETFDNLILSRTEKSAYLMVVPTISTTSSGARMIYVPLVMDASTGELLSTVEPSGGSYLASMTGLTGLGNSVINERVMEEISEDIMKVGSGK